MNIAGKPFELLPLTHEEMQPYCWARFNAKSLPYHMRPVYTHTAVCGAYSNAWYHGVDYRDANLLPKEEVCEKCLRFWTLLQLA